MIWSPFCSCFRVFYIWNFNWRLQRLNERAIVAMMPQMIDRDNIFYILQKRSNCRSTFRCDCGSQNPYKETWRPWQPISDSSFNWSPRHCWCKLDILIECGKGLLSVLASKTSPTRRGTRKDDSYQSATYSRLSLCHSSLQGRSTVRRHLSSLAFSLEGWLLQGATNFKHPWCYKDEWLLGAPGMYGVDSTQLRPGG